MEKCYINKKEYLLKEIEGLGYKGFKDKFIFEMPSKIYKYFPNTINPEDGKNYSQIALKNQTVYLQNPCEYDDPYDASICMDEMAFLRTRLKYYLEQLDVLYCNSDEISDLTSKLIFKIYDICKGDSKSLQKCATNLCNALKVSLTDKTGLQKSLFADKYFNNIQKGMEAYDAIWNVLSQEYSSVINPQSNFKVSCFTDTPFSIRMWSHYAHYHQGFCIEYEKEVYDNNESRIKEIYANFYPVIYSDVIQDLTTKRADFLNHSNVTEEDLWMIFCHGILRKSKVWLDQNEWRFVLCNEDKKSKHGFSKPFFKISKVFLGNKMSAENRKEIIKLCKEYTIPYIGVKRSLTNYQMDYCEQLCENCVGYLND